jgi:hypothetical protein
MKYLIIKDDMLNNGITNAANATYVAYRTYVTECKSEAGKLLCTK